MLLVVTHPLRYQPQSQLINESCISIASFLEWVLFKESFSKWHTLSGPRLASRGHHRSQLINESCSSLSAIGRTHATSYCHPFILTKMVSLTLRTLPLWPFSAVVDLEFGKMYVMERHSSIYLAMIVSPFTSHQDGFNIKEVIISCLSFCYWSDFFLGLLRSNAII